MDAFARAIGPASIIEEGKRFNMQPLRDAMTQIASQVNAGARIPGINGGALTGIRSAGLISMDDVATELGVAELLRAANRVSGT
jgi:hypothetical protein